ncbi:DedA family protein [Homoserinibacter sp. GY 40078]|uniref:DedA family protein n=1 Tax=Homoserinibacter sp. GY 40078 TaxID=2603275 RepID=UPI0011CA8AB5|nr:VTT domain-containing protein [Homoserinibacter sp. GY 40078]TXK19738.1 DedA family protein [Homoserinibacter sp. GY 40078]
MTGLIDVALSFVDSPWLLLIVLVFTIADSFVPTVPSDEVIIALSALAVAAGHPVVLVGLLVVALLGAIIGDSLAFTIGRVIPQARLRKRSRIAKMLDAATRQLDQHGARIIVTARFLPFVRVGITVVAGGLISYRKWLPYGVAACVLWATYTVAIGALAAQWFGDQPLLAMAFGLVLALVLSVIIDRAVRFRAARRARTADAGAPDQVLPGRPTKSAVAVAGEDA